MTNKKNILTIVQARMSSSRLPGKVMLDLCGAPVIARMIERVKLSSLSDYVVVATTTDEIDEVICNTCVDYGIDFYRGNPNDLLERHLKCANHFDADIILFDTPGMEKSFKFPENLISKLPKGNKYALAGSISENNIENIAKLGVNFCDLSSNLELDKQIGYKDHLKIKKFIKKINEFKN